MAIPKVEDIPLEELMNAGLRISSSLVGANIALLAYVGSELGLFSDLAEHGASSADEIAERTDLNARYVAEWANGMVAASILEIQEGDRFAIGDATAFLLADPEGPGYSGGAFHLVHGLSRNGHRLLECFRDGTGIGYDTIGEDVTRGVERMWAPFHTYYLDGWFASIPGLKEKLEDGGAILDVGCGRGRSTVALATMFPNATIVAIDTDESSIAAARELAERRSLTDKIELRPRPLPISPSVTTSTSPTCSTAYTTSPTRSVR